MGGGTGEHRRRNEPARERQNERQHISYAAGKVLGIDADLKDARFGSISERDTARPYQASACYCDGARSTASRDWPSYFRISSVSGLSRKLLQELNKTGQFERATICGISARMTM